MQQYYPPPAFHFTVRVLGVLGDLDSVLGEGHDSRFSEVSGLEVSWDIEEVAEGGENRFKHRLPTRGKYENLVLKRGAVTAGSPMAMWAGLSVGSGLALPIVTQHLLVMLLGERARPLIAWAFANAYPVKASVSGLDASKNELLIETFEFAYNYSWRVDLGAVLAG